LIKDGWTITADPYKIEYEGIEVFADLAAERILAAERRVACLRGPGKWPTEPECCGAAKAWHPTA